MTADTRHIRLTCLAGGLRAIVRCGALPGNCIYALRCKHAAGRHAGSTPDELPWVRFKFAPTVVTQSGPCGYCARLGFVRSIACHKQHF
eukprot:scaffold111865_cov69-Phaeocystis_antarctica.AAC.1